MKRCKNCTKLEKQLRYERMANKSIKERAKGQLQKSIRGLEEEIK